MAVIITILRRAWANHSLFGSVIRAAFPFLFLCILTGMASEAAGQTRTIGFAATALTISETTSGGAGNLTVELSSGTGPVTGRVCLEDGTATLAGADFSGWPGSDQRCTDLTLSASQSSATVQVSLPADTTDEPPETFTARLSLPTTVPGIDVDSARETATITIDDDDPTVVTLARHASSQVSGGAIAEGKGAAWFDVTLGRALTAGERIDVPLVISGAGITTSDYSLGRPRPLRNVPGLNTLTPVVPFTGAGARTARFTSLQARADGIAEGGSETMTVALAANSRFDDASLGTNVGGGAVPHPTTNRFSVAILDVVSTISVTGGPAITEGGTAEFTFTANPAPRAALEVLFLVYTSGDQEWLSSAAPTRVIFPAGKTTAILAVPTLDTAVEDGHGSLNLFMRDPGGWAPYRLSRGRSDDTVSVRDDETPPVVGITAGPAVSEGTAATFTVAADYPPKEDVVVNLMVVQSSVLDAGEAGDTTLTIAAGATSATLSVATEDDTALETERSVTVRLKPGTGYTVSPTRGSAAVSVDDDEVPPPTPVVRISGGSGVSEGGDATFTLTATPTPAAALSVPVTVSQTGTYAASGQLGTRTVTVGTGGSASFTVGTENDAEDENNGGITATVNDGTGYNVALPPGNTATVAVRDDDEAPTPVVRISGGSGVSEGGDATFTLTATPAPAAALSVPVTVSQTGSYAASGQLGTRTVTVGTGGSASFTVGTENDAEDENNGGITATVNDGTGYDVASPPGNTATVAVNDDDEAPTPVVRISGGAGVSEGGNATFTLTATPAPAAALSVRVAVSQTGTYAASGQLGTRTVTVGTGGSASFTVGTENDAEDENNGGITATVNDGTGYDVASPPGNTATVAVNDDDEAPTPVVRISGGSGVSEGGDATFTLTATPAPTAALSVPVTVSQTGTYAASGELGTRTVTVGTGGSASFTVGTENDAVDENNGGVTATVNDGTGYDVASPPGNTATVAVNDDDEAPTPVVRISGGSGVSEGGNATFTLTVSPSPAAALSVRVTVSQTGSYAASGELGARTVTVGTGGSASFTVGTENDAVDENNGGVTATVNDGTGYDVASPPGNTATVAVNDDDEAPASAPVVRVSGGSGVSEGGDATFTLTASPAPAAALSVRVTVSQTGSYAASGELGARTVTVGTGGSASFTVGTENDAVDENNGGVTATVNDGTGYDVASPPANAATVAVNDDDEAPASAPVVSISGGAGVSEGGDATFTLTASPAPATALSVPVTVSQTGTYAASGQLGARTVTVGTGGSASFTVGTENDAVDENNGGITATVNDGTGYAVASPPGNTATVAVNDDDEAPAPVVSISGGAGVSEGSNATFTLTASPAPATALSVPVAVSQTGTYAASGALGTRTVTVGTGGSASFTVGTENDAEDENNGGITATVNDGTGYDVASPPGNTATVAVNDDDEAPTPVVRISGGAGVSEGGNATFTLTASPAPAAALSVRVAVSQTGTYAASGALGTRTVTVGTGGRASFTVGTENDAVDENNGGITATVNDGTGYDVASPPANTATVAVSDDDEPTPVVSISGGSGVSEGSNATFTLTASPAPATALSVRVTVSQTGSYAAPGELGRRTVTVGTGGRASFTVGTENDAVNENNGAITATVNDGTGYDVAPPPGNAADVAANDDDSPAAAPEVTLSAGPNPVDEGGSVVVTATLSRALSSAVTIPLVMTAGTAESGDYGSLASITVAAGATRGTGTVTTMQDVDTADETFTVALGRLPAGVESGTPSSVEVRITDDDEEAPEVTLSAGPNPVEEGGSVVVTATLSRALSSAVTIPLMMTAGTAESGDYGSLASITVAAGATRGTGTVTTMQDADTADETFTVALGRLPAGMEAGTPSSVEVRITDDDTPPAQTHVTLSAAPRQVGEGGSVSYTVVLPARPSAVVTVMPSSTDEEAVVVRPSSLRFTPDDWNLPQPVIVTGVVDADAEDETVEISHAVHSTDPRYRGVQGGTVVLTVSDTTGPEFVNARFAFTLAEHLVGPAPVRDAGGRPGAVRAMGSGLTYTLAAGGAGLFRVDEDTGVVSYVGPGELTGRFVLTVRATDARGRTAETQASVDVIAPAVVQRLNRVHRSVLPEAARAASGSVFAAVSGRVEAAARAGSPRLWLAGHEVRAARGEPVEGACVERESLPGTVAEAAGPVCRGVALTLARAAADSGFVLPLARAGATPGRGLSPVLWGMGDWRSLEGGAGPGWDGEVMSFHLGADTRLGESLVAGVALSHALGEFDWNDRGVAGTYESRMTSAMPYVGWTGPTGWTAWAAAGVGRGEVALEDAAAARRVSDAVSWSAGGGARGGIWARGGTSLDVKGEAWVARWDADGSGPLKPWEPVVRRVRLALEGGRSWLLASGAVVEPSLELGVRHDGGDGETGTGVELGGRVNWSDPALGLTLQGHGRALVGRGGYREWGAGGVARFDPGTDGRGPSLAVTPSWGTASSGMERLWDDGASRLAVAKKGRGRLTAALGYGYAAPWGPGTVTPNAGLSLGAAQARKWHAGVRLNAGSELDANLEMMWRERAGNETPERGVAFDVRLSF